MEVRVLFLRFSRKTFLRHRLISGWAILLLGISPAFANSSSGDHELQYLLTRYQILRTSNLINDHQIDFAMDCFKNPKQASITKDISWTAGESLHITLDCARLKTHGLIEKAQSAFPKMRRALILSQVSKTLFMIPDGEMASESLNAELELQINVRPFHPYGLSIPRNWLKKVYDPTLFQLASLAPLSEEEKEDYRVLQNKYSEKFCADFTKNLSDYVAKYKKPPGILENLLPWNHSFFTESSLCSEFLLRAINVNEFPKASAREKKALHLLRQEYLKFSAQRRQELRQEFAQEYRNLITALPALLFITSSHPTDEEWIAALTKLKANSDVRSLVNLSKKELELVEKLSENLNGVSTLSGHLKNHLIKELRPLLQNPSGKDAALDVLKKYFPAHESLHSNAAKTLQHDWDADDNLHRNIQMIVATGAMGVCFIPTARLIGLATAAILKRGCMAVTGFPVNAYVFIHNITRYEKRLSLLASSFEESNSIVDMNLLNRDRRALIFATLLLPVGAELRSMGETSKLLLQTVGSKLFQIR